jgi:hypothetical protein
VTQQPRQPGTDLISDLQRWLMRSGARGVSRELSGQFRSAFGRGEGSGDVWESATTEPHGVAPECAWCPVCRAARRLNESGPGLASHVAAASDVLSTVVQDAMSVFESAMAAARPRTWNEPDSPGAHGRVWDEPDSAGARGRDEPDSTGARGRVWDEAVSPAAGGPPDESDDRH